MADPPVLDRETLERARDLGAVMYLSAYIRLMMRELNVEDTTENVNAMVMQIVEPLNHATEAMWRALMEDSEGLETALSKFGNSLDTL